MIRFLMVQGRRHIYQADDGRIVGEVPATWWDAIKEFCGLWCLGVRYRVEPWE